MLEINEDPTLNKITLYRTVANDLTTTFARRVDNKMIRHYKVPVSKTILGMRAEDLISLFIEKEEGRSSIVFISEPSDMESSPVPLKTIEATSIFKDYPEIKKQFKGKNCPHSVHQIPPKYSFKERILLKLEDLYNSMILLPNRLLFKFHTRNLKPEDYYWGNPNFEYGFYFDRKNFIQPRQNTMELVKFISVAFEEQDMVEATNAFVADVKLLISKQLIIHHLFKPQLMRLADTVGSGQKSYALACGIFVDSPKILQELGLKSIELKSYDTILNKIGCKYETADGNLIWLNNISPEQKYSIERLVVGGANSEEQKEAFIKNCQSQKDAIEKMLEEKIAIERKKKTLQ